MRNLAENPHACVVVVDPITYDSYRLDAASTSAPSAAARSSTACDATSTPSPRSPAWQACSSCAAPTSTGSSSSSRCRAAVHVSGPVTGELRADGEQVAQARAAQRAPRPLSRPRHAREHDAGEPGRAVRLRALAAAAARRTRRAPLHHRQPRLPERRRRLRGPRRRRHHRHGRPSAPSRCAIGNLRQMLAYARTRAPGLRGAAAAKRPGTGDPAARPGRRREPGRGAGHGARPARRRPRDRERRKLGVHGADDEALLVVVATLVASAIEIDWAHERAAGDSAAAVGACRPSRTADAPVDVHARAVLRGRRQHVPRRRLPHQGRRRPHPLVAPRALRRATGASSSPTRRCGSTRRSSSPSSATTSRAGSSCSSAGSTSATRPIRIEKTGRGRFRLVVEHDLRLECVDTDP